MILASGPELHADAGWRPLALAVVAAVLFGITLLAIGYGSQYSATMTMTGMRVAQLIVFAPLAWLLVRRQQIPIERIKPAAGVVVAIGLLDVGANVSYGMAAGLGPLVVVAVLGSLYPVITAVLAAMVLGERLRGIQYLGVAAAVGGLALMTATGT